MIDQTKHYGELLFTSGDPHQTVFFEAAAAEARKVLMPGMTFEVFPLAALPCFDADGKRAIRNVIVWRYRPGQHHVTQNYGRMYTA